MNRTKTSSFRVATAAFMLCWLAGVPASFGYEGPRPLIFDWTSAPEFYGSTYSPNMDVLGFQLVHTTCTPVPGPGGAMDWNDARILAMYDRLMLENRPVSIMLTYAEVAPLTGSRADALPNSLNYLSSKNYRLDYLWMDFELGGASGGPANDAEVAEAVRQVRAHADPRINQAGIGQYGYAPCSSLATAAWPEQNNPTAIAAANNSYMSTGVNVAMPSLYPYETYGNHATSAFPTNNRSPNKRSALFWGPLESFSNAKLNLPAAHQIVPYINDFVPHPDPYYDSPPPLREDNAALLKHARLRGADGYYEFITMSENEAQPYPNEEYRGDMLAAWSSLDWLFAGVDKADVKVLNVATNKTGGFEWSAVETPNGVAVLASDLSDAEYGHYMEPAWLVAGGMDPQYVEKLYNIYGHQYIPPNTHVMNEYRNPVVPEPTTIVILLSGAVAWLLLRRRCGTSGHMPLS